MSCRLHSMLENTIQNLTWSVSILIQPSVAQHTHRQTITTKSTARTKKTNENWLEKWSYDSQAFLPSVWREIIWLISCFPVKPETKLKIIHFHLATWLIGMTITSQVSSYSHLQYCWKLALKSMTANNKSLFSLSGWWGVTEGIIRLIVCNIFNINVNSYNRHFVVYFLWYYWSLLFWNFCLYTKTLKVMHEIRLWAFISLAHWIVTVLSIWTLPDVFLTAIHWKLGLTSSLEYQRL